MADDDDYMSDKFILDTEKHTPPGLVLKHSDKRAIILNKRKAAIDMEMNKIKKLQSTIEQDKRNEGLSSAISTENKGFEMIMRMGYKPGEGIGKNGLGRSEPVPVNIKTNRLGFGAISKKKPIKKITHDSNLNNMKTDEFRDRITTKKLLQLMEIDLSKSQKVCEHLDNQNDISKPVEPWYWPVVSMTGELSDKNDSNDEQENINEENKDNNELETVENENDQPTNDDALIEIPTEIKLDNITSYLRQQYAYCIWCGTSYNDQNDLNENCPGNSRCSH